MSIDLEVQKEIAKVGMTVTMGVTVVTAFKMNNKTMKNLHVGAGVALVGCSLWHHLLYQPERHKNKELKKSSDL
jgi:uncharacterized membrane protein